MYRFSIAQDAQNPERFGISNLEWTDDSLGEPLWSLNGEKIEKIRNRLICDMCRVVLYTANMPVQEYERYVQFFRKAHLIGVENVLLGYPAIAGASDEAIRRIIAIGAAFSIRILFCFEAEHMEEFGFERYGALRSEDTGLVYDCREFLKQGKLPYRGVLHTSKFRSDVVFLRIQDYAAHSLQPVLPMHGNCEIKDAASGLLARRYEGYFSFSKYGDGLATQDVIREFCQMLCQM